MKPELATLENLVRQVITDTKAVNTEDSALFIVEITNGLKDESNRLRNALIKASYKCNEVAIFKLYVHHHQAGLIELANEIWQYKRIATKGPYSKLLEAFINAIDDLLKFMRNSFGDYFNGELAVPSYFFETTKVIIQKQVTQLKRQLKQHGISEQLQGILMSVYDAYLQKRESCFSYERYAYLCYLHSKLKSFDNEQELAELLFMANFNSSRFFLYSINNLQLVLQANTDNLLLTIARLIKVNNQLLISEKGLHKNKPSIQTLVGRWLYEELSYCELQKPVSDNTFKAPAMKVKLNLSVDELGYFVDLFEKANVLESSSRTGVSKALAEICSTKERDIIKWKSLYNNSYSVTPYTQSSVKDILLKMLNIVTRKVYMLLLFLDFDLVSTAANL